jgi:short-subunit dehydrogenase involved in D-alanine esterification of teichoic acids
MELSKNTVFITGGASGIGLALAKEFLNYENTVIICGRSLEKLESAKEQYPDIYTIQCDVSNLNEVRQAAEKIETDFGSLNILVNNAGIQHIFDFYEDESAIEKLDEEININFRAVVHLTKLFLPILKKAPEAAIVNVSSFLGIVPKKSAPGYCATKAALHAFSKSLRYQLENSSIKIFEIITPLVDTNMTKGRESDMKKLSPESLAIEVLRNLDSDTYEIRPGRTKVVIFLNRLFPSLAEKIAKKR